jgi:arylsulfatase A-like enzyme
MRLLLVFGLVLLFFGCTRDEKKQNPNILFITTDCQAWEDLPLLNSFLDMPTIKRISEEGVAFQNHYSVAPLNLPARYSIISGQYPHSHLMMDNGGNWLPENSPVLMEALSCLGYKTVGIGKMNFKPWERSAGFNHRVIADGKGSSVGDTLKKDDYYYFLKKAGFTRWDYLKEIDNNEDFGVYKWPLNDTLDIDNFVGNETIKLLKNNMLLGKSPWFMWVSFNDPSYPWGASDELIDKYVSLNQRQTRYRNKELDEKPSIQFALRQQTSRSIANSVDQFPTRRNEIIRKIRAGHYANLEKIDRQLQKIILALQTRRDLNNTVIVITSINGAQLGDHDNFQGGTFYERSAHVPLIIWWPAQFKKKYCTGFTSHVDLFPTLVELAGGVAPSSVEGQSLLPILKGKSNGGDHAFMELMNNYSIVTTDYKFGIYTPYSENELYNRNIDPDELYNVAENKEYDSVVDSLTNLLRHVNPQLDQLLSSRKEFPKLISSVDLHQGDNLYGENVPFFPGKNLKMTVDVKFSKKNASGHIVTYDIENTHGFSLFIDNGRLYFGVRKFNKEFDYLIPGLYSNKRYKINIEIGHDGIMRVSDSSNSNRYMIQTTWPLPVQSGNPVSFERNICAGISGNGWTEPFGKLTRGMSLEGELSSCLLSASEK